MQLRHLRLGLLHSAILVAAITGRVLQLLSLLA